MAVTITVNGTSIPASNVTEIVRSDELLWSDGTGRAASSGLMAGSVVAKKQTVKVSWGVMTDAEYSQVRSRIPGGFFNLVISIDNTTLANMSAYRGNIQGEMLVDLNGTIYWKGVTVDFIER